MLTVMSAALDGRGLESVISIRLSWMQHASSLARSVSAEVTFNFISKLHQNLLESANMAYSVVTFGIICAVLMIDVKYQASISEGTRGTFQLLLHCKPRIYKR